MSDLEKKKKGRPNNLKYEDIESIIQALKINPNQSKFRIAVENGISYQTLRRYLNQMKNELK